MSVTDFKMNKAANSPKQSHNIPILTAVGQTALLVGAWTPGFRFQIDKVSVMATAVTATITVDVQIGGVSVLTGQITPVAGTETAGTLTATLATLRGKSTDQLQVKYTTNGSGAATNLVTTVQIRPYPLDGESAL